MERQCKTRHVLEIKGMEWWERKGMIRHGMERKGMARHDMGWEGKEWKGKATNVITWKCM
jgi:hypothetical protein